MMLCLPTSLHRMRKRKGFDRQMKKLDTPQKKEDYVKQNWHKSPKASAIMLSLSKLDPATMTSELNDEVVDYVPVAAMMM